MAKPGIGETAKSFIKTIRKILVKNESPSIEHILLLAKRM